MAGAASGPPGRDRGVAVRFLTYRSPAGPRLATALGDRAVDLALADADLRATTTGLSGHAAEAAGRAAFPGDPGAFLALGADAVDRAKRVCEYVQSCPPEGRARLERAGAVANLADLELLAPIGRDARVFCVGLNYMTHVRESGRPEADTFPGVFLRCRSSFTGHRGALVRPRLSAELDWEMEFTAVIGKPGRHIARDDALDHVAGYTIANDGSVRDYQRKTRHVTPGKNFDRSGSMGPWIVTADEIPRPHDVDMTATVNGRVVQRANTSAMVFDLESVIRFLSEFTSLQPGDIIATGNPGTAEPGRWLAPGDTVRFSVEGIGTLDNTVVDEDRTPVRP